MYDIQNMTVAPTGEQVVVTLPGIRIAAQVCLSGSNTPIADFTSAATCLTLTQFLSALTADDLATLVGMLAPAYFERTIQPPA